MPMELKPIDSLVVYRDLWKRGGDSRNTSLLNRMGMCCLGFACAAIGVPGLLLQGKGEPADLLDGDPGHQTRFEVPGLTEWSADGMDQLDLVIQAMAVNDAKYTPGFIREWRLQRIFARGGIALTFEDYAPLEIVNAYRAGMAHCPVSFLKPLTEETYPTFPEDEDGPLYWPHHLPNQGQGTD